MGGATGTAWIAASFLNQSRRVGASASNMNPGVVAYKLMMYCQADMVGCLLSQNSAFPLSLHSV